MGLISEERRNVLEMGVWTRTARHVIDEIEMIRQDTATLIWDNNLFLLEEFENYLADDDDCDEGDVLMTDCFPREINRFCIIIHCLHPATNYPQKKHDFLKTLIFWTMKNFFWQILKMTKQKNIWKRQRSISRRVSNKVTQMLSQSYHLILRQMAAVTKFFPETALERPACGPIISIHN